jgi:hypothetical protein
VNPELERLFDIPFCFCLECRHDPKYGYCRHCRCHNHQAPPDPDQIVYAEWRFQRNLLHRLLDLDHEGEAHMGQAMANVWARLEVLAAASSELQGLDPPE